MVGAMLVLASWAMPAAESGPSALSPGLLGNGYRIEVTISKPSALLHWIDSLAQLQGRGLTAGKTQEAHQIEYQRHHGKVVTEDLRMLEGYRWARMRYVHTHRAGNWNGLTLAFFRAGSIDEALDDAEQLLEDAAWDKLARAVRYFEPRFDPIWNDGALPKAFVERVRESPQRRKLEQFLIRVAGFYGIAAEARPVPHLVLTTVMDGHGTHAQAIGTYLLVELRRGESLADEVAPIAHENAHFLYSSIGSARLEKLRTAAGRSEESQKAWAVLNEALPTAIAQGAAERAFSPERWSMERRWYHIDEVDRYAKAIYPLVAEALEAGSPLDPKLVRALVARF